MKYINSILKVKFKLNTTFKPKPIAGLDDLLLILIQHWACNKSIFPTKDDRHDIPTIMLFQAYISGRLAEFAHLLKGKASEDPLGKREEYSKSAHPQKATRCDYNDDSDADADDEPECDNDSGVGNNAKSEDDVLFNSKDDGSDDSTADKDIDRPSCLDSGYNSNGIDITIIEDMDKYYTTKLNKCGQPLC